jgi:hypothetical protein
VHFTATENVGRGFILRATLPAQWVVSQAHQVEVSAQSIMPGKTAWDTMPISLQDDLVF